MVWLDFQSPPTFCGSAPKVLDIDALSNQNSSCAVQHACKEISRNTLSNTLAIAFSNLTQESSMFATPAQFTEIQKGQMDAAFALGQTFFDATERLLELNLAAAKATLKSPSSASRP